MAAKVARSADLDALIEAWPTLSNRTKDLILKLARVENKSE